MSKRNLNTSGGTPNNTLFNYFAKSPSTPKSDKPTVKIAASPLTSKSSTPTSSKTKGSGKLYCYSLVIF